MMKPYFLTIAISCVFFGIVSVIQGVDLTLPKDLTIGAGSAAYQIEGAWNVSDKSESIWDRFTHDSPKSIADGSNGDVASNFYYKYKEDVQFIKSIGLSFFRFSIAWSRVFPTGFANSISKDGIQYYKNLTAELVANGIEPVVTLYHWDHPQVLEDYGGWTNELMSDWFVSYAEIIFNELGNSVKIWTTFNEPNMFCTGAYQGGSIQFAPGKNLTDSGKYLCMHNILKAHAKTYHMYNKLFRKTQQGEIGIVSHCKNFIAANSSDTVSPETAYEFECGWVFNPIFKGDYPEIMKERIAMISKAQGHKTSRLPEFSKKWISTIHGSFDYLGLNHYTSVLVSPDPDEAVGIYNSDSGLVESSDPSWPTTAISTLCVVPAGFGNVLRLLRDKYDNPPVRVMENGYSDYGESKDYDRIKFHHDYLTELLTAVKQDNCNVKSYSLWSLMDDFEWNSGYTPKFGILSVNLNDTNRPRTARLSACWWTRVLKSRKLQPVPTSDDS